jgi:hypothetical protein
MIPQLLHIYPAIISGNNINEYVRLGVLFHGLTNAGYQLICKFVL